MRPKPICYPWIGMAPFTVERVDQLRAEGLVMSRYQEPPLNPDGSMMMGVGYPLYAVDEAGNFLPTYECDPILTPKGVAALGLCEGLKVEVTTRSYRCGKCGQMQESPGYIVWISDSFIYGNHSTEEARAMCKRRFQHGSAVCVNCAPKSDVWPASTTLSTPKGSGVWAAICRLFS